MTFVKRSLTPKLSYSHITIIITNIKKRCSVAIFVQLLSTQNILTLHMKTAHDRKYYKCKSCGKSLSDSRHLRKHIRTIHEGPSHKDYNCENCGKSFSQAVYLQIHIKKVHEGHIDHKCESCNKSFSEAGNLKNHIHTVHEGHKDHKCEFCGK